MKLSTIVTSGPERPTRLHSQRRTFVGFRSAGGAFLLAWRLARRREPDMTRPWMVNSAVDRLDGLLDRKMTLLELGSGSSTAWYAARVASVISIETDEQWLETTRRLLATHRNAHVRLMTDLRKLSAIRDELEEVDVLIIDHNDAATWTRVDSLRLLLPIVKRVVVLDNSDRPLYRNGDALIREWAEERFVGFPGPSLTAAETSIFVAR